jgi:DNA-damage-inducible protein J
MDTVSYSFRIERDTKNQLDEVCQAIGMSTATAFNIFAKRMVAEKGMPFKPVVVQLQEERPVARALAEVQEKARGYDVSEEEVLNLIMSGRRS